MNATHNMLRAVGTRAEGRRHLTRAARYAACLGLEPLEPRTLMSVTFATVDDFQLAGLSSEPQCMATDTHGNVYAGGDGYDAAKVEHAVIREKHAGSSIWTTLPNVPGASCSSLALDPTGNLYAIISNNGVLTIYEMPAGQSSFSVIDPASGVYPASVATDAAGDVFVTGTRASHWVVREQAAGSVGFTTVDDFIDAFSYARSNGLTVVNGTGSSAGIYAIGYGYIGSGNSHWLVRKSADGGSTWATVDNFIEDPASPVSSPQGITSDRAGNVFVVGYGNAQFISGQTAGKLKQPIYSTALHWIVRKSPNGDSWSTNDDYQLAPNTSYLSRAYGVAADLAGNIYVTGEAENSKGIEYSVVRSNAGGSWQTVDNYVLSSASLFAVGHALAVGSDGTIYAAVAANRTFTDGWSTHWIIRAAAGPAAPQVVQAAATFSLAPTTATTLPPALKPPAPTATLARALAVAPVNLRLIALDNLLTGVLH